MKQQGFFVLCGAGAVAAGLVCASCRTKPIGLPRLSDPPRADSPLDYIGRFKDNPEMFPRELTMPGREELLALNWAMQKAVEDGKLKVRLVAPPLQLTGDPNLDRSSTYEALLVADDLKADEWFTNVYEVRVSPKPELCVVRAARTAASLQAADRILAEEEIARLRLDITSLKSGSIFATNMLPVLTNRLATALTNYSKNLSNSTSTVQSYTSNLVSIATNLLANTNLMNTAWQAYQADLTNTTKSQPPTGTTNAPPPTSTTNAPPPTSTTNFQHYLAYVMTNETLLAEQARLQSAKAEAVKQQAGQQLNLTRAQDQLDAARDHADLAGALLPAIQSLQDFWTNWANPNFYLSDYSTNGPAMTNRSAVSILLRPQAVAGLKEITIDVIRKSEPAAGLLAAQTRLSQQLAGITNTIAACGSNLAWIAANLAANSNLMTSTNSKLVTSTNSDLTTITNQSKADGSSATEHFLAALTNGLLLAERTQLLGEKAQAELQRARVQFDLAHTQTQLESAHDGQSKRAAREASSSMTQTQMTEAFRVAFSQTLQNAENDAATLQGLVLDSNSRLDRRSRVRQIRALVARLDVDREELRTRGDLLVHGLGGQRGEPFQAGGSSDGGGPVARAETTEIAAASLPAPSKSGWPSPSNKRVAELDKGLGTISSHLADTVARLNDFSTNLAVAWKQGAYDTNALAELRREVAQQQEAVAKLQASVELSPTNRPAGEPQLSAALSEQILTNLACSSDFVKCFNTLLKVAEQELTRMRQTGNARPAGQEGALSQSEELLGLSTQLVDLIYRFATLREWLCQVVSGRASPAAPSPSPHPPRANTDSSNSSIDSPGSYADWLKLFTNALSEVVSENNSDWAWVSCLYGSADRIDASDPGTLLPAIAKVRGALLHLDLLLSGCPADQPGSRRGQTWRSWRAHGANSEMVGRILEGDQAVFQVPVLHGVVTTTAFLLADDGAAQMFGHKFADQFYAAQVTFRNPNDRPILLYGNTMRLVVRMNAVAGGAISEDGQLVRSTWWATFEPLDYDAIRRMVEGMQEHAWQTVATKVMDLALMAGGGWVGVGAPDGFSRAFGVVSALSPKLRDMLEADLRRNALNFREKGLNSIEEIAAQGILTRYVFLPKGPIYGTYGYDIEKANALKLSAGEDRMVPSWVPFSRKSTDFGKSALQPAYIHDIRREEVYVQGKRILASDPLSSVQ